MTQYSQEWWFANGDLAANQRAAVFGPGNNNTFAPIYSDPAMTVPMANPTTTDALGILTFYAPDGVYFIFVGPVGSGDSVEVVLGAAPGAVDSVNGQTGNVVLDASDVGAQPIATINAKGDLYAGTGNDATTRLPVGADGEVLTADSSDPTGLTWAPGGGGAVDSVNGQTGVVVLDATDVGADPAGSAAAAAAASQPLATINAKGDLYAGTANDTTTRVPVGTNGQVLTADSSAPPGMVWATPASAPVTSVNGETGVVVLDATDVGADPAGSAAAAAAASQPIATIDAKGDLYAGTGDNATARRSVGTDGQVLVASSLDPTGLTWATLGTDPTVQVRTVIDAKGDLYAGTANDATTRLPVGTNGQVLTANSATGTGLEWTTPATAPVTSVNGETGVVVLDAADVGAQPIATLTTLGDIYVATAPGVVTRFGVGPDSAVLISDSGEPTGLNWDVLDATDVGAQPISTIDAKGDLYAGVGSDATTRLPVGTNGQVLTANSATGTGLEWATPAAAAVTSVNGETGVVVLDAADVGAQPITTIDAKGDLYVGTGADATARQAVGTNGFTLVADSTLTNGLKWGVQSSVGLYPRSTGYIPAGSINTTRSSKTATLDTMFLAPVYLLIGGTLTSLAYEVSGAVALAVARFGIYGSDSAMLPTGAPIADYGTNASATTGTKTVAVSTALAPGLYWVAIVGQTVAPTLRFCAGQSPWVASATFPAGSGVGWNNGYAQTGVSLGLPSIGSITDSDVPLVGLKF